MKYWWRMRVFLGLVWRQATGPGRDDPLETWKPIRVGVRKAWVIAKILYP